MGWWSRIRRRVCCGGTGVRRHRGFVRYIEKRLAGFLNRFEYALIEGGCQTRRRHRDVQRCPVSLIKATERIRSNPKQAHSKIKICLANLEGLVESLPECRTIERIRFQC